MKVAMTKIAAATVLAFAAAGAQAATLNVTSLMADTGSFNLGGSPGTPGSWNFAGAGTELIGAINTSLGTSFTFFGGPVHVFLGDGTYIDPNLTVPAPVAVQGGNPVSAVVDDVAGTITVDLSAWTASWNGTNFNQGNTMATGTWNAMTGAYNIGWSSTVVGGSFNGQTGNWTLQGTAVAAVPEAETYAMMLAGLGLVGTMVARRRKLVA